MSISASNLGTSVDFAVATTLAAINANMFEYLYSNTFPVVNYCWLQNTPGGPLTPITLQDLMDTATSGGTNGTNPFNVPNWSTGDPVTTDITNMQNSNFACGIQLQLGLPSGMVEPGATNPNNYPVMPYVLALNTSSTNTAVFNLLCVQFQVVFQSWGAHGSFTFNNDSQPSGSVWGITLNVPLNKIIPPSNAGIPQNVIDQLNSYGPDLFSIQQLFLDFSSAVFTTVPTFTASFPATVADQITPAMVQTFMTENEENNGLAVLGYSLTQDSPNIEPSSLYVGSLTLDFDEYNPINQSTMNLSTLNYLCNQGGTPPPQNYSGITWNWIDEGGDGIQYDGAIAVSNNIFIPYLATLLNSYVAANCWEPNISCHWSGITELYLNYYLTHANPPNYTAGTGGNIINYTYNSGTVDCSCGYHGLMSYYDFKSSTSYTMTVTVSGSTVTIVQQLVIYVNVKWESSATEWGGNYIDTTLTDVYQMNVGEGGNLVFGTPVQTTATNGSVPSSNDAAKLLLAIGSITDYIDDNISFAATNLQGIPAVALDNFVFPGGQTFTFAQPQFSNSNDLVAYITYNQ